MNLQSGAALQETTTTPESSYYQGWLEEAA